MVFIQYISFLLFYPYNTDVVALSFHPIFHQYSCNQTYFKRANKEI